MHAMRLPPLSVLLAACSVALNARSAAAICINTCSMTLGPLSVTPPLPACATVTLTAQTCICEVELTLANRCSTEFDAVDFEFYGCASTVPCTVLPSYENGAALAIGGTGQPQWVLHVENASVEYALSISANVTAFNANPSSCAIADPHCGTIEPIVIAIGAAGLVGLVARRLRRQQSALHYG
jgi:hypothetical protein